MPLFLVMRFKNSFIILILILLGCGSKDTTLFKSMPSSHTGIDFQNTLASNADLNILNYLYYYNGAGVGMADVNGDDLPDIYFVSNLGNDKLYLNRGNFKFQDITEQAGIGNNSGWSFGVTLVDINNDGLIDIYLTKVGDYRKITGKNLLYVNKGLNQDGIPVFSEEATKYRLDISSYGTQTAFFDYDLDGDLDAFLLNHSVHPNSNYGFGNQRDSNDPLSGDRLLENREGKFYDISEQTGIHQGVIGYGLDVSIGDLNGDNYPDLYIGNDFFENDYLYLSNGDKTFTEVNASEENILGHTSHFSMGNTLSDINSDGRLDIISLDMLPEELADYKTSGTEFSYPIYHQFLKKGYRPQYMQNTVHVNNGSSFSEVAYQFGLSATEWSWGVISADLDLDGHKDLYITNGIPGATNDMDFIKFASQQTIQEELQKPSARSLDYIDRLPSKKIINYAFQNESGRYQDVSENWFKGNKSFSNGVAVGDLDNDGDLDIVVNNINESPFVFQNTLPLDSMNYLKVKFKGVEMNRQGVGARVRLFYDGNQTIEDNYPNRTYLSSNPLLVHFGLGASQKVDSLKVTWPSGKTQVMRHIKSNQTVELREIDSEY